MFTTVTSVPGDVSSATTLASPLSLCKNLFFVLMNVFSPLIRLFEGHNSFLFLFSRNLSNLNLGGEISPAVGDLRNLQSM